MSEVIATIRRIDKCYDFMDKVGILWLEGVRLLRFNLGKSMSYEALTKDIILIKDKYPDMKILIDIPYPGEKVRIRTDKSYDVHLGNKFFFCAGDSFPDNMSYELVKMSCFIKLSVNDKLLYNDGEGMFTIVAKKAGGYIVEANGNFTMLDSKSLSIRSPNISSFSLDSLSTIPMDYLALSFIEDTETIEAVRSISRGAKIIAKIETAAGYKNIDNILGVADGIMIARGDLGLGVPLNEFYKIESDLGRLTKQRGKLCFVATDIMQSMRMGFFPSRADITDFCYLSSLGVDGYIISLQLAVSDNIRTTFKYMRLMDYHLVKETVKK